MALRREGVIEKNSDWKSSLDRELTAVDSFRENCYRPCSQIFHFLRKHNVYVRNKLSGYNVMKRRFVI